MISGPKVGEDAAIIDMGDRLLVAKSDPITFAADRIGWYAVQVNANDVACTGGTPKWFLATLLVPEEFSEAEAEGMFDQVLESLSLPGGRPGGRAQRGHLRHRPPHHSGEYAGRRRTGPTCPYRRGPGRG